MEFRGAFGESLLHLSAIQHLHGCERMYKIIQEDMEILEAKAAGVNLGCDGKQGGLLLGDVTCGWWWWDKTGA